MGISLNLSTNEGQRKRGLEFDVCGVFLEILLSVYLCFLEMQYKSHSLLLVFIYEDEKDTPNKMNLLNFLVK